MKVTVKDGHTIWTLEGKGAIRTGDSDARYMLIEIEMIHDNDAIARNVWFYAWKNTSWCVDVKGEAVFRCRSNKCEESGLIHKKTSNETVWPFATNNFRYADDFKMIHCNDICSYKLNVYFPLPLAQKAEEVVPNPDGCRRPK